MTAVYQGRGDGLDYLLTVHDDGTADAKVKPTGDPWAMWSPPVALTRQPVEATS